METVVARALETEAVVQRQRKQRECLHGGYVGGSQWNQRESGDGGNKIGGGGGSGDGGGRNMGSGLAVAKVAMASADNSGNGGAGNGGRNRGSGRATTINQNTAGVGGGGGGTGISGGRGGCGSRSGYNCRGRAYLRLPYSLPDLLQRGCVLLHREPNW